MIIAYTGRPGSGKTVAAVRMVHKLLKKKIHVYSNIVIHSSSPYLHYWKTLPDIYAIQNGYIFMDEGHIYMRSRKWEGLPEEMELKLAQHRKDGLNMIITTQNLSRIDVIVRELVDIHWRMKHFGKFFIAKEFDPDMDRLMTRPLRTRFFWATKRLLTSFDTLAKVNPNGS